MVIQENNELISEDLNGEERRIFDRLLNLIIPTSEDGKMPCASDVGFFAYMQNENLLSWIREGLHNIVNESHKIHTQDFSKLSDPEKMLLIDNFRRKNPTFFGDLTSHVLNCYYQHEEVLDAIGLEARAPFPQGYFVEDRDLFLLLEPVYLRGKIYRD